MYAHASSRVVDRNNKKDLGRMGSEADEYHRGVREKKKHCATSKTRTKRYLHNKLCYRSRSAVQYHKLAIRPETIQQSKLYLIL